MTTVSIRGLVAGYGQDDILRGVDLEVESGTIVCVIGPNGAGKSTVLKAISGLVRCRRGTIEIGGTAVTGQSAREVLALGAVHVPQERSLFPLMTVWDNVLIGGHVLRDDKLVRHRAEALAERFPLIRERRRDRAGSLSGGQQKLIEIARALLLEPRVILMDEPSMGLDPKSRQTVFEMIRTLNESGQTVLLVEQNARAGLAIAHRGAVMDAGVVRLAAASADLLNDPRVAELYLGAAPQGS
ncbi:MAG: branched-chain amino acid transport system ATP-binding protein [Gaiellales bacterium]|jgi:branched-chain amino acid transport system ATP-binding protein|nr:branched-chain amino acid transport system ATP-binding protein [Gaiellales bacterium]